MVIKKVAVRKSTIQGRGLYALTDFKKGDVVVEYNGPIISAKKAAALRRKHCLLMSLEDGRIIDGKKCIGRFINHSCRPTSNVFMKDAGRTVDLVATRRIRVGEEILLDYQFDTEGEELYPCSCRGILCRGYINTRLDIRKCKRRQQTAAASSN
jgi:SET domain-containing protein